MVKMHEEKSKKLSLRVSFIAIVILILCLAWAFFEPFLLTKNEFVYHHEDIPKSFENFRIVFVSDIHFGKINGERRLEKLVDEINEYSPDVVILGGDYVDGDFSKAYKFFEIIEGLKAEREIYAVFGNHENENEEEFFADMFAEKGIVFLDNENESIEIGKERIFFCGTRDEISGDADISSALEGVKDEDFTVFISHNPKTLDRMPLEQAEITDFALAGHFHGGQITLFGLLAISPDLDILPLVGFEKGINSVDGMDMLVSNGAGQVYVPMRFFARREMHIIDLSS